MKTLFRFCLLPLGLLGLRPERRENLFCRASSPGKLPKLTRFSTHHFGRLSAGLLLFCCAGVASTASAGKVIADAPERSLEPDVFGYNLSNWNSSGVAYDDDDFRHLIGRLKPANLRYPGGTLANSWDWETGTIIRSLTGKNVYPNYSANNLRLKPQDLIEAMPKGTEIVYVLNMARPTPSTGISVDEGNRLGGNRDVLDKKIANFKSAIKEFKNQGHQLKYIELGNEFYLGALGGTDKQGAIYTGHVDLYIAHAQIVAAELKKAFPDDNLQMAVQGEPMKQEYRQQKLERPPWMDSIYRAKREGRLNAIDAITFHWYVGPRNGDFSYGANRTRSFEQTETELAQAYEVTHNSIRKEEFDPVPSDWRVWITEYNTFRFVDEKERKAEDRGKPQNAFQGTWLNGMVGAIATAEYLAYGEQVELMNVHAITRQNPQWQMMDSANTRTANGAAFGAIGLASQGMSKVRALKVVDIDRPSMSFRWDRQGDWSKLLANSARE